MDDARKKLEPVRLYRELDMGEQLVVFADPAESQDYCAAVAISKKYFDAPMIFNEVIESSQFGYELYAFCKYIFNKTGMWPKLGVERNTGAATIYVLKQLNYPDLFRMVDFASTNSHEGGSIGWLTTGHWSGGELMGTRRKMLDDLALCIRQGVLKMYDTQQLRQLKSFNIVNGRGQQRSGRKDDLVMACYSQDTEVLTVDGWKLIMDVKIGEQIPSLNLATNEVSLATNTQTINNAYKGAMISFKGRNTDFLVTPNHRMVVHLSEGHNKYTTATIVRADALIGKHFTLHKDAIWGGREQGRLIVPKYTASKFHKTKPAIEFDMDDFLKLLGFYIAEGSSYGDNKNGWKLIFSQKEYSKGHKPFKELLEKLKIKYSYNGNDFVIHNTHLAKYFKQLVPGLSDTKNIPQTILQLHPKHLKHLYDFMMLGDGHQNNSKNIYTTISKQLCDDFLVLINKLGWSATWAKRKACVGGKIKDRQIHGVHDCYNISIIQTQIRPRFNHHNKDNVVEVDFDGRQVCLALDKNNVMLVRRNNTMMWSGNTAGAWQLQQITPNIYLDDFDDESFKREKEKLRFR